MTNIKNTTVKSAKPALAKGDFGPWGWSCPLAPEGGKGVGWSDYHWLEFRLKSFAVLPVFRCMPHLGFVLRGKNWQFIEVIVAIGIDSLVLPAEIENICFVHSLVLGGKMEVAVYSSHQCHQCWHWNRQSWCWKLLPPAVVFFIAAINAASPFAKLLTIFCITCTQSGNLAEKSEWKRLMLWTGKKEISTCRFPCCALLALSWKTTNEQIKIQAQTSWVGQSTRSASTGILNVPYLSRWQGTSSALVSVRAGCSSGCLHLMTLITPPVILGLPAPLSTSWQLLGWSVGTSFFSAASIRGCPEWHRETRMEKLFETTVVNAGWRKWAPKWCEGGL